MNEFDQFKTTIDGVDIHFIHQRSKNPNAMPLLLLNGWPSSIVEYAKVIGPLTDPVAHGGRVEDSFNVVIPSMPGFGFSGKPRERGYDPERIARIWVKLMARLGYTRYSAHGSDWGSWDRDASGPRRSVTRRGTSSRRVRRRRARGASRERRDSRATAADA